MAREGREGPKTSVTTEIAAIEAMITAVLFNVRKSTCLMFIAFMLSFSRTLKLTY